MKYLVVNADDLGATRGINRGIIEAHRRGVVTSASLLVTGEWCGDAVMRARAVPSLAVGLHVDLGPPAQWPGDGLKLAEYCRTTLAEQRHEFEMLMSSAPTHLDSHHNAHRDPRLLPCFQEAALDYRLPLREQSEARYVSSFYGRWDGETHGEQISVSNLLQLLSAEVGEGITELSCHPGYVDPDLRSDYAIEREMELRTLCDPAVHAAVRAQHIRLIGFGALRRRNQLRLHQESAR